MEEEKLLTISERLAVMESAMDKIDRTIAALDLAMRSLNEHKQVVGSSISIIKAQISPTIQPQLPLQEEMILQAQPKRKRRPHTRRCETEMVQAYLRFLQSLVDGQDWKDAMKGEKINVAKEDILPIVEQCKISGKPVNVTTAKFAYNTRKSKLKMNLIRKQITSQHDGMELQKDVQPGIRN